MSKMEAGLNASEREHQNEIQHKWTSIRIFFSVTDSLGIERSCAREIVQNPEKYFEESYGGALSLYHLNLFLRMVSFDSDLPVKEIKLFTQFLKHYQSEVIEYSDKEIEVFNIGVKYIEKFIGELDLYLQKDTESIEDTLALNAYVLNRMVKMKRQFVEQGLETLNLNNVIETIKKDAEEQFLISNVGDKDQHNYFLESRKVYSELDSLIKISSRKKYLIRKTYEGFQEMDVEDFGTMLIFIEDATSLNNLLEFVSECKSEFNSVDKMIKLLELLVSEKEVRNYEDLTYFNVIKKLMHEVAVSSSDKELLERLALFIKEEITLRKTLLKDTLVPNKSIVNRENFNSGLEQALERFRDSEAGDLYATKAYLSALFLVNNGYKKGYTLSEITRAVYQGENHSIGVKKDKMIGRDYDGIKFNTPGIELHYHKDTMLPVVMAAYNRYRKNKSS